MKCDNSYKLISIAGNQHCYQYFMAVVCFLFWFNINILDFLGVKLGYLSLYEQRNGIERVKLHMEEVSCDEEPHEDKIEVGEVVSNKEDKERIRKYITMKAAALCGL